MRVGIDKQKIYSAIYAIAFLQGICGSFIGRIFNIANTSVVIMLFVLISMIVVNPKPHITKKKILYFLIISVILLISYVFYKDDTIRYALNFLAFGIPAFYFDSSRVDTRSVLKVTEKLIALYLILYLIDGRASFISATNYWERQMGMAYVFLPMVISSFLYVAYYKKFSILSLFNLCAATFFLLVDCATRGAIVSLAVFGLLYVLLTTRRTKRTIFIALLIVLVILVMLNLGTVLKAVQDILDSFGVSILALDKMINLIKTGQEIGTGRNSIYAFAVEYIQQSPIIGHGIGGFENLFTSTYGKYQYPHQLFLQLLCEFGVFGLFGMCTLIIGGIKSRYSREIYLTEKNILQFMLFCCVMPLLMVSSAYWLQPTFWLFFSTCLDNVENENDEREGVRNAFKREFIH